MTVSVLERVSSVFPVFKEQMLGDTPSHPPMALDKDKDRFISLWQVHIAVCSTTCPVHWKKGVLKFRVKSANF